MEVHSVINDLKKRVDEGTLSHAFLIETNHMDQCLSDLEELIQYMNCPHTYSKDCHEDCNLCHLIHTGNLPSYIKIYPDGSSIKKSQLIELRDKFATKPVYSKYNVYVVCGADVMNEAASNTILKFLEEPEDYIVGFFITTNRENVISTIQSRCQIFKINYEDSQEVDETIKSVADEYLYQILKEKDFTSTKRVVLPYLNTRPQIEEMFLYYLKMYTQEIESNYFPGNNFDVLKGYSLDQLLKQVDIIKRMLQFNHSNVNLELLLDDFVIEMRNVHE